MDYGEDHAKLIAIDLDHERHRYMYRVVKRVFDFVASLLGLILLSPVFLIVAIAIKLEDPKGPVFYSQTRLGRQQLPFKMYKFRSMIVNADKLLKKLADQNEVDGAMFKIKRDPRVTNVGRFIRKYSLDELPQLMNVLLGQMSLVGPRPPLPREVANYTQYDMQRLAVKPGCTGLWQATARNSVGFDEMVYLDLMYISKRGVLFDSFILLKTLHVFIKPSGAY
ncbi:sugar transferase [Levilactobacillus brevis]|uniref:Undecaprenyl-phosphate galactose phosphotransferase family protein n=2 Tax=Levilactobacillus brevis TaxID=1580 RepID=U2P0E2_LEVBR|nr:sugar transferase [Levilactobacillus brevis]ERK43875.1 undecaprenyl-phosphate galactose phosphotransferase family protein [Levilactobacillus brevis ATCC 14869 = DSM 20054]KIO99543.1 Undecaprenyl-phosphate galactosephosphotransferase [Levilactobacillus brevis]KRK20938.1 priming glycosyltransferase [Levilactobacillus brevis ATCC 14869 = DSM 20054]MCT3571446.1 sugar transferase [Levilactobacillus brevis]PBQ24257.1 sugar transferase [Levilactobacillus brevis]